MGVGFEVSGRWGEGERFAGISGGGHVDTFALSGGA